MHKLFGLPLAGVLTAILLVTGAAAAADVQVPLTIENNQFQPAEVKVKANPPFVLLITNKNPKAAEFESKDLRVEKVVPAGKTVNVRVRALKPGSYAFFDDFNKATTGKIVAE